ncbi:MAG: ribonuclease R [Deltaproteobacteria bacterium]
MARRDKSENSNHTLLDILERAAPKPLSIKEIARRMGPKPYDRRALEELLGRAAETGKVARVGKGRWRATAEPGRRSATPRRRGQGPMVVEGRYTRARGGFGFVATLGEDREKIGGDVFIPRGREADALHGDTVTAEVRRWDAAAGRSSGEVVGVVTRAHTQILGRVEAVMRRGRGAAPRFCVVPHDERLPTVEVVGGEKLDANAEGRTALVRLTDPPTRQHGLRGEVERLLGDLADPEVQVLQISLEAGLRIEFPEKVKRAARRLPHDPDPADFASRQDLREMPFVTIDGATARDYDDAVYLESLGGGRTRLRVAIADVSHYVRPGTLLDEEAQLRGTSTYFPDRAIPMLPERLSTELCSLMPERERLVLVAEMVHDKSGVRSGVEVYRAVIRSAARLTYTQVAGILSEAHSTAIDADREQFADVLPMLQMMHELMRSLHRRRMRKGSLDLDLPEALVDLSEEGRTIGLRTTMRNDAHRMVEEMMLAANCAVAGFLTKKKVPLPYRIHEAPESTSVDELNLLLYPIGIRVAYKGTVEPIDVQRALDELSGHRLARVLSRQVLRSLKQARYATENVGHFGLAFECYCHFTSPIRRYPDLMVHRQIGRILDGHLPEARELGAAITEMSAKNSTAERTSMGAERAMLDLKKAEFMLGHLLQEESATIVGIERFGIFVELDAYPVEGLVSLDDLPGRFRFDGATKSLIAARGGRRFRLGDPLMVEAVDASLERRKIRFVLAEDPADTRARQHRASADSESD